MSSDVSAVTNYFPTANEGFTTTTSGAVASGATTVGLNSVSGLTNGTVFVGIIDPGLATQRVFTGTVNTGSSSITGVKFTRGTAVAGNTLGATVVDYVTGTAMNMITTGILKQHSQAGAHTAVTATSLSTSGAVTVGSGLTVSAGTVSLPNGSTSNRALTIPYKFSAYRSTALTPASGAAIVFDSVEFDTGGNYSSSNGKFTAPVAGFYLFTGQVRWIVTNAPQNLVVGLGKNGTMVKEGDGQINMYAGISSTTRTSVAAILQLSAGDYVQLLCNGDGSQAVEFNSGAKDNYFQGFLMSAT